MSTTSSPGGNLVISIDFDRVIHDVDHPEPGRRMGPPMPDAIKYIKKLKRRGFTIVVYTLRARTMEGAGAAVEWLDYFKVPFDDITYMKPEADLYLDDKGYRFTAWNDESIKEIYKLLGDADG